MKRKDSLLLLTTILVFVIMSVATIKYPSPSGNVDLDKGYLFTFAHITDSQFSGSSPIFESVTSWLAQQDNVSFVVHTGDIVNNPIDESAWKNAYNYMHHLDNGCRWVATAGDDDVLYRKQVDFTNYKKYFGNESFDQVFIVEDKLLFIFFGWNNVDGSISQERLEWMDEIILKNENLHVVVCLHPYLFGAFIAGALPESPTVSNLDEVWSHIDKHENIILTLSGHVHRNWVHIHVNGKNKVWTVSTEALMEKGYIRLFNIYEDKIEVYAYSPWTNRTYTGVIDRFTIELNPNGYDVDGDFWRDNLDIMPTHPLVPNGIIISVAIAVVFFVYWIREKL